MDDSAVVVSAVDAASVVKSAVKSWVSFSLQPVLALFLQILLFFSAQTVVLSCFGSYLFFEGEGMFSVFSSLLRRMRTFLGGSLFLISLYFE